ncbi:MAG: aspartate aminotransferase family protein, partial [Kineosporiaceae bacterium]
MDDLSTLFGTAADEAARYRASLGERPVVTGRSLDDVRAAFDLPLPEAGLPPDVVLDELVKAADGGLVATAGPRFFGFVVGGALPSATAA